MEATTIADTQAERSDLRAVYINPRSIRLGIGVDAIAGQQINQTALDTADQFTHTNAAAAHIQQQVSHQLARTVVSNLTTAIDLHHRNIPRKQHMLGLAGLTLSKYGGVFEQTDFDRRISAKGVGKALHRMPGRLIVDLAQLTKAELQVHNSTMCTIPVACRALLISRN